MFKTLILFLYVLSEILSFSMGFSDFRSQLLNSKNLFAPRKHKINKLIDDESCENQLKLFREALSAREQWALHCKFNHCLNTAKYQIFYR